MTAELPPDAAAHLRALGTAALAGRDVAGFVAAVSGPRYRMEWWHEEIGRRLDVFIGQCLAGRGPRLILCAPPRHGKSLTMGVGVGPCAMVRRPGTRVIYASHSQTIADKTSLMARRVVGERLAAHYPHMRPSTDKWTASWWEVADGGFRALGAGVGSAGEGAHIAIVDDPFGSIADARSPAYQRRVYEWFLADIESRIMDGGGIVVMHTRWHEGDLVGRLLRDQPGVWTVLSWPAIATHDEPHRRAGEALSARYPLPRLLEIRERLSKLHGASVFEALYQQSPVPASGGMFKREHFERRYTRDPMALAREAREAGAIEVVVSLDAAGKGQDGSDFCAIHVWMRAGARFVLLDRSCRRLNALELDAEMARMVEKWAEFLPIVMVEDAALGMSYYQRHEGIVPGLVLFNPTRDTPGRDKGKPARAAYMQGPSEAGQIELPEAHIVPGVEEMVDCWCAFPLGANDDDVDAASQVFVRWRRPAFDASEWEGVSCVA